MHVFMLLVSAECHFSTAFLSTQNASFGCAVATPNRLIEISITSSYYLRPFILYVIIIKVFHFCQGFETFVNVSPRLLCFSRSRSFRHHAIALLQLSLTFPTRSHPELQAMRRIVHDNLRNIMTSVILLAIVIFFGLSFCFVRGVLLVFSFLMSTKALAKIRPRWCC